MPGTRAAGPQRLLGGGAGRQHRLHIGVGPQSLQGADGREDDEELPGLVTLQRVGRAHPDRLELFGLVGHRGLLGWHAGHQKWHIEAAREVAVGDPVGQDIDLIGCQLQAACPTLRGKRPAAVHRRNVARIGPATIGAAGEEHAQLFKALADRGNGLRQVQVALTGPAAGLGVCIGVGRVDAATRKHIRARGKAGSHGTACHQHLEPQRAIAQQQHGGRGPKGRRFALRMQELGGTDHRGDYGDVARVGCSRRWLGSLTRPAPDTDDTATGSDNPRHAHSLYQDAGRGQ